jgi:hypothetical protein
MADSSARFEPFPVLRARDRRRAPVRPDRHGRATPARQTALLGPPDLVEGFVLEQVANAPREFDVQARNPAYTMHAGDSMAFGAVYGSPFARESGVRREDYQVFAFAAGAGGLGWRYDRGA